ncbi:MAG: tRNA 2-selenouridine(34) synthase MnmH [Bacteroidales bacterium]
MIKVVEIEEALELSCPIVDVRSPGEYLAGHILGSHNVPLFSDNERAHIGTAYKQESKKKATGIGYIYANPKRTWYIDETRKLAQEKPVIVHCWRGGMRSRLFAEHLHENGIKDVYIISGGYKAFRQLINRRFAQKQNLLIIGGFTGSGKTALINELQRTYKLNTVDLEALACHKGSAFGSIGMHKQPTTEHFQNILYMALRHYSANDVLIVEDESMRIGQVSLPQCFYEQMRNAKVIFLNIPRDERVKHLIDDYVLTSNDEGLEKALKRISKRLGSNSCNDALNLLAEKNYAAVAEIALHYYDKAYSYGLAKRKPTSIVKIDCPTVDPEKNAKIIYNKLNVRL